MPNISKICQFSLKRVAHIENDTRCVINMIVNYSPTVLNVT